MATDIEHASAIDAIYAAAIEPAKWPKVLGALRHLCDAESASHTLQHIANGTGTRTAIGYNRSEKLQYFNGFAVRNELFAALLRKPGGVPHPHQTLVDDELFRRGYYFNEFCRPNGLHFLAGLIIARRDQVVEWISINRDRHGEPYDRRGLRELARLAPHLRRASEAACRLTEAHAAKSAWEAALDALTCGVVMLDHCGRVVFANQSARQMAAEHDGFALRCEGISATCDAGALARAVGLATDGDSDGIRRGTHLGLPRRDAPAPLSVNIIPLPYELPWQLPGLPAALLLIVDPAHSTGSDAQTLGIVFGLTRREAELTTLLANGCRLYEAAERLGISRETARTHLANALGKTGTNRQTDLVRLALSVVRPGLERDAVKLHR